MPIHLVTLERSGEFEAKSMESTEKKCDAMATRKYRYEVTIETRGKKFSPEGFVINNEHIHEFFERTFGESAAPWKARSCETMATQAAEAICHSLVEKGIDVKDVKVGIYGSHGARITAHCAPEPLGREIKRVKLRGVS